MLLPSSLQHQRQLGALEEERRRHDIGRAIEDIRARQQYDVAKYQADMGAWAAAKEAEQRARLSNLQQRSAGQKLVDPLNLFGQQAGKGLFG